MATQRFQQHLAALSPYFQISKQPSALASDTVSRAVYLLRHGILKVSHNDFNTYVQPFLRKIEVLQSTGKLFAKGQLSALQTYRSWISKAHVGMVSRAGLLQTADMGRHFRQRYGRMLKDLHVKEGDLKPLMRVWTDSATQCRLSAITFADAFSGTRMEIGRALLIPVFKD